MTAGKTPFHLYIRPLYRGLCHHPPIYFHERFPGFFRRLHGTTADTKLQSPEPSDLDEADTEVRSVVGVRCGRMSQEVNGSKVRGGSVGDFTLKYPIYK